MVLSGSQSEDALTITNSKNLSYSEVACVTILTWDVIITLSDEVCQLPPDAIAHLS